MTSTRFRWIWTNTTVRFIRQACQIGRCQAAQRETVGKNGDVRGAATRGIADARGRLLQAARKLAEKTGKRLADIIAEASDGKLSLDGLRDLTDADVTLVSVATSRMV